MRAPERRPNGLTFLSFFRMTDVRAYSGITTFQLCTLFPMTSQIEISTGLLFCNWFKEVYQMIINSSYRWTLVRRSYGSNLDGLSFSILCSTYSTHSNMYFPNFNRFPFWYRLPTKTTTTTMEYIRDRRKVTKPGHLDATTDNTSMNLFWPPITTATSD